jgi:hypothetical protein
MEGEGPRVGISPTVDVRDLGQVLEHDAKACSSHSMTARRKLGQLIMVKASVENCGRQENGPR